MCELKIVTGLIFNLMRGRFTLLPFFRSLPHYVLLPAAVGRRGEEEGEREREGERGGGGRESELQL